MTEISVARQRIGASLSARLKLKVSLKPL